MSRTQDRTGTKSKVIPGSLSGGANSRPPKYRGMTGRAYGTAKKLLKLGGR